jgi:hypothetical protein
MTRLMRGSWESEFAGHGPLPGGVATFRPRHEPRLHAGSAHATGEHDGTNPVTAISNFEPKIEDREWLPGADRRTMCRRLAERRAVSTIRQPAAPTQTPAHASWRILSPKAVTLLAVTLALGFLGGLYVASSREARPTHPTLDPVPTLQLDTNVDILRQRGNGG